MFSLYNRFTNKYENTRKVSTDEKIDCLSKQRFVNNYRNDLLDIERYVNNRNDLLKKWNVFLTYGWIEEAVTWEDTCSPLKQNQCFFYLIRFAQNFDWFVFLNIFVFALKTFTSYLQKSQFCVTFVHLDNGSLILQRTTNIWRTHNISFSN